jgi:hypothetical protein
MTTSSSVPFAQSPLGLTPRPAQTWTLLEEKEPWAERGNCQGSEGATAAALQVTGIGASGRVTLRSFSDSCRVIFFGPTVVSKKCIMRTPRVQKWRPRAYQRLGDVERAPSVSRDHFCVVGIAGVIARLSCKRLRPICPTCGRCSD